MSYSKVTDLIYYFNGVITEKIIREAETITIKNFVLVDITFYLEVKLDLQLDFF